ncbi:glycerate dehydrogenase [Aeromonas salmonicida]|uniref:Glycerate dehydrogenase n=1 Tax=Aeromonas salmonicida subsp. pectinolytica 34mel TaxID=1324960 RepID=T0PTM2_AERSA|nr:D-2-hydroxyacid dehydrogenase [Aeromonas salmonicida]ATP10691.1 glycerate dehydrogenase [Aeromonas salmonicida subsp. pectinolytica 34mel]EQC06101.1 2-hydroxyacid dehydrogenase [Aeromonas salmonicida subsp. pectinolytica 34mel]TNI16389.1 glycerate dehydrogenase [Aeromonas salmonicida]HEH9394833.1 D-2-hydroxyacid dehydrogenase [Aeromonas salmonicida]
MQQIVFLDSDTLDAGITLHRPDFPHHWQSHPSTAPEQVVERLRNASIAIINKVRIGAPELAQLPDLKLIALAATGSDNVDLEACRAANVGVCNIRNYSGPSVPEHAMALMLALSRNLFAWRQSLLEGRWQQSGQFCFFDHNIMDLHGKQLGIIGKGTLGQALGERAQGMGMIVRYAQSQIGASHDEDRLPLDALLQSSDVVSLHCPLTPYTRNLIGERELALMKPGALLINVGRGGLVDEAALLKALANGRLGGAGFDVASVEPPPPDHPLMQALQYPNFILTPHVAWASEESMQRLADQLIDNINAFAEGRRQHRLV